MVVFLAPLALVGLGLLSIPILVHLFKPRRVNVIPFSSLRWLRASQHRLSRRVQWHQVILFLLRAAFLVLLVLVLARPVIVLRRSGGGRAERLVIVDTSRSMGYRRADGRRTVERAREASKAILTGGLPGDRTTLILAGNGVEVAGPLSVDVEDYVARVNHAEATLGESSLADVLEAAAGLLHGAKRGSRAELFFVTDNLGTTWSAGPIARFVQNAPVPLAVHVVDVGPPVAENAWINAVRLKRAEAQGKRFLRVEVAASGERAQERVVRLEPLVGMPERVEKASVQPGRAVMVEFELPAGTDLSGAVANVSLEPPDALASDDMAWLLVEDATGLEVLVLEVERTQVREMQPGHHLRTALEALNAAGVMPMQLRVGSPESVTADEIEVADVILLVDVPSLSDDRMDALRRRVEQGAGLVVFLGPRIDTGFYNTRLYEPLRPVGSILPVQVGEVVDAAHRVGRAAHLVEIQWGDPLLAPFRDPAYSDLAQVNVFRWRELAEPEVDLPCRVLASFDGQTPAIIRRRVGLGEVVTLNTTADDAWSDLPRRKCYVPCVDQLMRMVGGAVRRTAFEVGEAVSVPLPIEFAGGLVNVVTPGGRRFEVPVRTVAGRPVADVGAAAEAGLYKIMLENSSAETEILFTVQPARGDSAMARFDEETLRQWWAPATVAMSRPGGDDAGVPAVAGRVPLIHYLMTLACMVFLAEMFLVHSYCARAHPRVLSSSVISADGFFGRDRKNAAGGSG